MQRASFALQVTMVQSTKQDAVIFAIQSFLAEQGIKSGTYTGKAGGYAPLRTLFICDSQSLIAFFEGVMPYLIVKRKKSEEALVWAREKQARKDATAARLKRCEELYAAGASTGMLRKACGVNHDQIRTHFKKVGIRMRTIGEAQRLRFELRGRALTDVHMRALAGPEWFAPPKSIGKAGSRS